MAHLAAAAAYIAVNLAALAVAAELGVQPGLAHGPDGRPLYAPYPLSIAVPAMMLPHLLFFGPIEAFGTALVVSYIYRMNQGLLYEGGKGSLRPLFTALAILIVLTPLGLLATGTPWGEWGIDELRGLIGYVPEGMERYGGGRAGLFPGYSLRGVEGPYGAAIYALAAFLGSVLVVAAVYIWGRLWKS